VREVLKEFHALVDKESVRDGRHDHPAFQGDGAMILFGLPAPAPERCRACGRMCDQPQHQDRTMDQGRNRRWSAARTGFKIGTHYGPIVASRLGGRSYQHITRDRRYRECV